VGVLLVLVSMIVGARVVSAADDTVAVWAAARSLPVGAEVTEDALVPRQVRLTAAEGLYLRATSLPKPGQVLLRAVGAGELIPSSALGPATSLNMRPVTIELEGPPPQGLVAGALVDVWVAPRIEAGQGKQYGPPENLVGSAHVSAVSQDKGGFSAGGRTAEILVPVDRLPKVLLAQANGAAITLALVPGSGPGADS
jgi:hypothetical protein